MMMTFELTINFLYVMPVVPGELELRGQLLRVVDGVHDGVGLVGVGQPQHVTDLMDSHPQQVDAVTAVGPDGLKVLLVIKVHVADIPRVGDFTAVTIEVVLAVLVRPWGREEREAV